MNDRKLILVGGSPGTGKTSALADSARKAIARYQDRRALIIASLTNAAANEIASRGIPVNSDQVGTLHSLCYRQLGTPPIAETLLEDWNAGHAWYEMTIKNRRTSSPENDGQGGRKLPGDTLMEQLDLYRHRLKPEKTWPEHIQGFARAWREWKAGHDAIDFTDMLELHMENFDSAPFNARLGIFDECFPYDALVTLADGSQRPIGEIVEQRLSLEVLSYDITRGELTTRRIVDWRKVPRRGREILQWGDFYATDDHPIFTREYGYLPFKEALQKAKSHTIHTIGICQAGQIRPEAHYWELKEGEEEWIYCLKVEADHNFFANGILSANCQDFSLLEWKLVNQWAKHLDYVLVAGDDQQCHPAGTMIETTEGQVSIEQLEPGKHCLVTMYQGASPQAGSYFLTRHFEKAPSLHRGSLLKIRIDRVDTSLPMWQPSTLLCTPDHIFPVCNIGACHPELTREVRADNLDPQTMRLAVQSPGRDGILWSEFSIEEPTDHFFGTVWSLNVEKSHTYFANGLLTHNCIYEWRGANPQALIFPDPEPLERRILPQSYRLPRVVHKFCEAWGAQLSQRWPKEYAPRREDGEVVEGEIRTSGASLLHPEGLLDLCEQAHTQKKTLMILTTCNYQLSDIVSMLRKEGFPFHNPWRPSQGNWNPLLHKPRTISTADRLLAYFEPIRRGTFSWSATALHAWIPLLRAEGTLQRGAKESIKKLPPSTDPLLLSDLASFFAPEALSGAMQAALAQDPTWLIEHGVGAAQRTLSYPASIAQARGLKQLEQEPLITVGTIHSVKGGEADRVAIFPDLSPQGYEQWRWGQVAGRDAIIRQFYVGLSRAKEQLILCSSDSQLAVSFGELL